VAFTVAEWTGLSTSLRRKLGNFQLARSKLSAGGRRVRALHVTGRGLAGQASTRLAYSAAASAQLPVFMSTFAQALEADAGFPILRQLIPADRVYYSAKV
jgi:hypothetical protein